MRFSKFVCVAVALATLACAVSAEAATVVRRRGVFGRQVTVVRNQPVRAQAIVVPGGQAILAPSQAVVVPHVPQAIVVPNQNFLVPQQQLILVR